MRLTVKVKLKAAHEEVRKVDEITYEVATREAPEKGRANAAVIRLLAENFGIAKSRVSIMAGHASRAKIIKIA
jgi:uncharacterized protein YggU (UPF0235/DUF167 family)